MSLSSLKVQSYEKKHNKSLIKKKKCKKHVYLGGRAVRAPRNYIPSNRFFNALTSLLDHKFNNRSFIDYTCTKNCNVYLEGWNKKSMDRRRCLRT